MEYLRGFLPWLAFAAATMITPQWAPLVALLVSAYFLIADRRAGVPADAQILPLGTTVYFGLLTAVQLIAPHAALLNYENGLSAAWLALIAGGSLLIGRPFTEGIAKRRTDSGVWDTPAFRRTNTVLTRVWTISFAVGAAGILACEAIDAGSVVLRLVQVLLFAVPITFTRSYVKRARARATKAEAA